MKKLLRNTFIILLLVLSNAGILSAQQRGGYAGVFMRMGLGARVLGMGGASVGMPDDGFSAYYNPAGLPILKEKEVLFSYRNLSLDRSFSYLGYSAPMPPSAGLSVGWIHSGVSNIDGRDFAGNHTTFYDDSQNGFLFAFGIQVHDRVNIGIGGTVLREYLVDLTAKGFGLNVGTLIKMTDNIYVGGTIRDIGAHYSWNTEDLFGITGGTTVDNFPKLFIGGISYRLPKYNTIVLMDLFKNEKSEGGYRIGFENTYNEKLVIRGGLNDGNVSAGFGITFPVFDRYARLDYSILNHEIDPELAHVFTFNYKF